MGRPHGRARVNPSSLSAFATCDRCGFLYNHDRLRWDYQWAGNKLQNKKFLVCETCYDIPQENIRTILLPPDPVPIRDPRPRNVDQGPVPFFYELAGETGANSIVLNDNVTATVTPGVPFPSAAYSFHGSDVLFSLNKGKQYSLEAIGRVFEYQEQPASLVKTYNANIGSSISFGLGGSAIATKKGYGFPAVSGAFTTIWSAGALSRNGALAISAFTGTITATWSASAFAINKGVPALRYSLALSNLSATRGLAAGTKAFSLAGSTAQMARGPLLQKIQISIVGSPAQTTLSRKVTVSTYQYSYFVPLASLSIGSPTPRFLLEDATGVIALENGTGNLALETITTSVTMTASSYAFGYGLVTPTTKPFYVPKGTISISGTATLVATVKPPDTLLYVTDYGIVNIEPSFVPFIRKKGVAPVQTKNQSLAAATNPFAYGGATATLIPTINSSAQVPSSRRRADYSLYFEPSEAVTLSRAGMTQTLITLSAASGTISFSGTGTMTYTPGTPQGQTPKSTNPDYSVFWTPPKGVQL